MPYHIRKKGDEHCVYNKDTGEEKGCSDSWKKAVAFMRKLYLEHEKKEEKSQTV